MDKELPDGALPRGCPFDESELVYYDLSGLEIELRNGRIMHPFDAQGMWLSPFPPSVEMIEGATGLAGGNAEQRASAIPAIKQGIAASVVYHDLRDPQTGELWEQWWQRPERIVGLDANTLFSIWAVVVNGELPNARPKESTNGSVGGSIRKSTATRTRR